MFDKKWVIANLFIGAVLLASASDAAAKGGNPTFMNYHVGGQARRNAYHALKAQGLQTRLQEAFARAELARVRSMMEFERRYASLKLPGSSWQSANATSSLADNGRGQSGTSPDRNLGLTQRDVDAMREHYEALAEFHTLRREQTTSRSPHKRVASSLPGQVDRTSGRVVWPALLREDSRFSEDVQRVEEDLAKWVQDSRDPTSLAALRVRKTVEKMMRNLLVMLATGRIDQAAYNVARAFLERTAHETQCTGSEGARDVTADFAWAR